MSLAILLLSASCTSLFFYPEKQLLLTPDVVGIDYKDLNFKMSDGETIHGWFLPGKNEPKKTIFFLHGNAENISTHLAAVYWLPAKGFNVVLIDYRGYGKSTGQPEIRAIHRDILEVWKQLNDNAGVDPQNTVVFGQSIGGAIALRSAIEPQIHNQALALIVESPFIGYQRIAREKITSVWFLSPFFWLPYLVINDSYSPDRVVSELPSNWPILVTYCEVDEVIPTEHSKDLLELLAGKNITSWSESKCGHGGFLQSEANRKKFVDWLNSL